MNGMSTRLKTKYAKDNGVQNVRKSDKGVNFTYKGKRMQIRDEGNKVYIYSQGNIRLLNLGLKTQLTLEKLFSELDYAYTNWDNLRGSRW